MSFFRRQENEPVREKLKFPRSRKAVREAKYSLEAVNYENKNHTRLHRMQAQKLRHNEREEEHSGQTRDAQALPVLPQAYSPQRSEVIELLINKERVCF